MSEYNVCLGANNVKFKSGVVEYFGDGLTDKFAFEYVHSIGGKSIFIVSNKKSMDSFIKLKANGVIDECFEADFGINSKINKYIKSQISTENI